MRETIHYSLGEEVHPALGSVRAKLDERATVDDPNLDVGGAVVALRYAVANGSTRSPG